MAFFLIVTPSVTMTLATSSTPTTTVLRQLITMVEPSMPIATSTAIVASTSSIEPSPTPLGKLVKIVLVCFER